MSNHPQDQPPVYSSPNSAVTQGASTTALWLEIIFGIFGLLGIGHAYSRRVPLGLGLMIGWWVYIVVAFFVSTATLGFAACLFLPIGIAVPVISGIQARTYVQRTQGTGNWSSVGVMAGGGCLTLIIIVVVLFGVVLGGSSALQQ